MEIVQLYQPEVAEYRETLVSLMRLCVTANFSYSVADDFYSKKLDGLEQYLLEEKAYLFVAREDGDVGAFLWACELNTAFGRKFHVLYFAVLPEYQGHGLGALLLKRAEEQAKALNIPQIELMVTSQNLKAVEFYVHQSYQTERLILTKKID